ncbi:MAG: AraC family transcriptional regulator [Bacteroides sp.]|nr:AraC family transcriptional regulator [Bacteroides sp.]
MAVSKCVSLSKKTFVGADSSDLVPRINESGLHGTPDFPVAIYDDDVTKECVNWHWHEEFEAGFVSKGSVHFACGSCKYTLSEGDVFFVNSNVLHFTDNAAFPRESSVKSVVFHGSVIGGSENSVFHKKYLLPILNSPNLRDFTVRPGNIYHGRLLKILTSVWDSVSQETPDYEIVVRSKLSDFFRILIHMPENNIIIYPENNFVQENRVQVILDHIHSHYSESLTLDELSKAASVSKSEVLRCFKNIIGQSPIKYLKNYRLQTAAHMIKNTDYSIGTICELCGFDDSSYFSKSFKEIYHCTPSEYGVIK